MSHEPTPTRNALPSDGQTPLTFGLAFAAFTGFVLMTLALSIGVVQGETANGSVLSATFIGGLILMLAGTIGWIAITRPFTNFDDINQPHYTGHDHHDDHADAAHEQAGEVNVREPAPADHPGAQSAHH